MAGMSNIISGAILLVIVIGIYVAVTYMRNKKLVVTADVMAIAQPVPCIMAMIVMTKKRENRLYA